MRLINTYTLQLEEFTGKPPSYAILSHTWTGEEVSLQEFTSPSPPIHKEGYAKITNSCAITRKQVRTMLDKLFENTSFNWGGMNDGKQFLEYLWVDTCCIDKSSSAELSESINSMFRWYRDSRIFYAYLADVSSGPDFAIDFRRSKWFRRGWTLQELIAPCDVHFYSKEWDLLGTRDNLADLIAEVTSIDSVLLRRNSVALSRNTDIDVMLDSFSVARRMSWAAERKTTREEDIAYCLMGIFKINMPLLYGEGQRAFLRLQEEIVKVYNDQSILAWQHPNDPDGTFVIPPISSLWAMHPSFFHKWVDVSFSKPQVPMSLDSRGLELEVDLLTDFEPPLMNGTSFAILQGHIHGDHLSRPAIQLDPIVGLEGMFRRKSGSPLLVLRRGATPHIDFVGPEPYFSELPMSQEGFISERQCKIA